MRWIAGTVLSVLAHASFDMFDDHGVHVEGGVLDELSDDEREYLAFWAEAVDQLPEEPAQETTTTLASAAVITEQPLTEELPSPPKRARRGCSEDQIQLAVLESLIAHPEAKNAQVFNDVNIKCPDSSETEDSIRLRRMQFLYLTFQPMWFHQVLMDWRTDPVVPPSAALTIHLQAIMPRDAPSYLRTPTGLHSCIKTWFEMCITPLRKWDRTGEAPCTERRAPLHSASTGWMVLNRRATKHILREKLRQLRRS